MRRALATATIAGAIALVPFTAATATAAPATAPVLTQSSEPGTNPTDDDEPLTQDGNDDTGKYGLIGLSGLFGLFGYKKYKEHQAARSTNNGPDGTSRHV